MRGRRREREGGERRRERRGPSLRVCLARVFEEKLEYAFYGKYASETKIQNLRKKNQKMINFGKIQFWMDGYNCVALLAISFR